MKNLSDFVAMQSVEKCKKEKKDGCVDCPFDKDPMECFSMWEHIINRPGYKAYTGQKLTV
jgi:hypothetical protein